MTFAAAVLPPLLQLCRNYLTTGLGPGALWLGDMCM